MAQPRFKLPVLDTKENRDEDQKNEVADDVPVRGTRPLFEIFERCNIVVCDPANFEATKKN